MTSPQQQPAPEPDPRDEAEDQPLNEELPAPDEAQLVGEPQTDADLPDAPLLLAADDATIPESDRAPGVLRETPVGGKLPLDAPGPAPDAPPDPSVRDMPAPEDLAGAQPEPDTPPTPESEPLPSVIDMAESAPTAEETPSEPTVESIAREEAPVTEGPSEGEAPPPVEASPAPSPAEYEAAPPPVSVARSQDWDEDISPELAAILFGGASAAAEKAPAEAPAATPRRETPSRLDAPVTITTADEARSQPIRAGQFTAPPPGAPVTGKYRYARLEEPLRGDKGRRIEERWEYFGPDFPALEGLLVKRVESEEIAYADGSWKLTFRRDYSQGRDERTIRISGDGEYTERTDRIRRPDAASGKTARQREHVCLRFAAPLPDEKRGFLGGLFKRGNGPQTEGPKRWREATESEQRDARQTGGQALKRGLFEKP